MNCPDFEALLATSEDPGSHPETTRHLARGCPACERRMQLLATTQELLALGALPRPREEWRRAAGRLPLDPGVRLPTRWNGQEVAVGGAQPALRGAGLCRRHRSYAAGPATVDIAMLDPSTLVGTVSRSDACASIAAHVEDDVVCVLDGPGGPRQVALESNGDFRFEGVDPGRYLLLVEGRDWNVVLEDVDLTTASSGTEAGDR